MENKSLIIFLVLAIAGIFLIETFTGREDITGRAAERGVNSCSDTDGFNINVKGTVTTNIGGEIRQYDDACSGGGGRRVKENYCDGNRRTFAYEFCQNNMICNDGECILDRTSKYY